MATAPRAVLPAPNGASRPHLQRSHVQESRLLSSFASSSFRTPAPPVRRHQVGPSSSTPPGRRRPRFVVHAKENRVQVALTPTPSDFARLRALAKHGPGPFLQDPHARLLCRQQDLPETSLLELSGDEVAYLALTRFLDDCVLEQVQRPAEDVRQVVLLSEGSLVDGSRPYRLALPRNTVVFDVSPAADYEAAASLLKDGGVRMPPGTLLSHVSADISTGDDWRDEGWGEKLCRMGYRGDRPSIWLLQGSGRLTGHGLLGVLGHVRGLAKSGAMFVGSIPASTVPQAAEVEGEAPDPPSYEDLVRSATSLFAANGLKVDFASVPQLLQRYKDKPLFTGRDLAEQGDPTNLVFVAVQQRLSDIELENAQREIARAIEDGDEEGFEDFP